MERRQPTTSEAVAVAILGAAAALCLVALPMSFYSGWAWVLFLANAVLLALVGLPFVVWALVRQHGRLARSLLLALGALLGSAVLTGGGTWLLVRLDVI